MTVSQEEDDKENATAEVAELKQRIALLTAELKSVQQQAERVSSQRELLEKYSTGLFAAGASANSADLLDDKTIGEWAACTSHRCVMAHSADGVFTFLDTYEEKALKVKVSARDAQEQTASINKELAKVCTCVVCVLSIKRLCCNVCSCVSV